MLDEFTQFPLTPLQHAAQGQPMTPEDVIRQAAPRQAPSIPVEQVLQSIQQETQMDGAVFEQFGNTVFAAHPLPNEGMYIFRALNADSPQNYMQNTLQFFATMQNDHGAVILVTVFDDPTIINIAKGIARMLKDASGMEYVVTKLPSGKFRMVVRLGAGL